MGLWGTHADTMELCRHYPYRSSQRKGRQGMQQVPKLSSLLHRNKQETAIDKHLAHVCTESHREADIHRIKDEIKLEELKFLKAEH